METKSSDIEKEILINKFHKEINKRDNIIKLLTGVIEVIKTDVNIKNQQLDYLINHMKNNNYEGFDYSTCINSIEKIMPPLKYNLKSVGLDMNLFQNENEKLESKNDKNLNKENILNYDLTSYRFRNLTNCILRFLNFKDMVNIGLTCKTLSQLAKENKVWKDLYFKDYDMFLFFNENDKCRVEDNAKIRYEENKESELYKDMNFKEKYIEIKRINKNWEENRPVVTTISTAECVTCLNLDSKSNELIYSSVDGSAGLYRLYSYRKLASEDEIYMQHHKQTKICDKLSTFYGHGGPIWCIDRNEEVLFTGSYDKTIKLWDIKSGKCTASMRNHSSWVSSLHYDVGKDILVSGSWDCTIRLWNMKTLQNSLTLNLQFGNFVYCVRSNLAHNEVIAGTELRTIDIWDVNKRIQTMVLFGHLERITTLKNFGDIIISGSEDKQARLWDKRTGNCEILFTGHSRGITQVEIDHRNNRVFTASIDKSIKIWDIRKNKEVRSLVGHSSSVNSIAFDQTKLISGSKDNSIRIWNFLY
jgi:WD40 repeat protein